MAGTDKTKASVIGGPSVILVEPQLGENIGFTARAMMNGGLSDLRIVKPRDGWPNPRAEAAASGAGSVIGPPAFPDYSRCDCRLAAGFRHDRAAARDD